MRSHSQCQPPGCASLEVEFVSGRSTVTAAYSSSPLKLLTPRSRGQSVWACTSSFGGGLVAGDKTRLDLRVGAGARCFVGTQSSTKVYRNPAGEPCGHATRAVVAADSLLVFAPDAVQPFAASAFTQRQEFHLAQGAGLVLLDWFTAGRTMRGERWLFDHFQTRNEVFVGDERVLLDSLHLDSANGSLASAHRVGHFNCFSTLFLVGAPLQAAASQTLGDIASRPVVHGASLICSASPVSDGVILRVAGRSLEAVGSELRAHLRLVCSLLGDDPFARKW